MWGSNSPRHVNSPGNFRVSTIPPSTQLVQFHDPLFFYRKHSLRLEELKSHLRFIETSRTKETILDMYERSKVFRTFFVS